ncbi:hypothetical protein BCR39DRAFT_516748 [Naematelia encephala]|uniref:Uncharacterized protein n=1 Tax=Naematelia encephala TaxID=71784 RepID=A0A1Y2BJB2_9TREE|nr:hypothetical protein BCR39DRAFT_516748 [Naematelia encephala]
MGIVADVVVISDAESDDVAFLGAGPSKRPVPRLTSTTTAICIDSSSSDGEDGGLVSLADLIAPSRSRTALSPVKLIDVSRSIDNGKSKGKGKERAQVTQSYQSYTRPFGSILDVLDGLDDEDARTPSLEEEDVPLSIVKRRSHGAVPSGQAGNRKKRKSTQDPNVDLGPRESHSSAQLSKEEKEALKAKEKAEKQLAKATAKAAKEAEESYQKKLAEVNKLRTSKNDVMRELVLYLSHDLSLPTSPIAGALPELTTRLTDNLSSLQFLSAEDSHVPGLIKLKRHVKARWDSVGRRYIPLDDPVWEWEPVIMVVVAAEEVVDKIAHDAEAMLPAWIRDIRLTLGLKPSDLVVVLVRGLGKYYAKTKALENREFTAAARAGIDGAVTARVADSQPTINVRPSKATIEQCLVELQIAEEVHIVHVEKTEDVEDWLWNLSADIALRPYKLLAKSHLNFAPPDKPRKAASPTDALEMMLQEVQGITPSAASGIAAQYPNFAELMRAFERAERKGGAERGEGLLADCEIKNLKNGTASGRKLNKALAKRVYHVFRGEDSLALA